MIIKVDTKQTTLKLEQLVQELSNQAKFRKGSGLTKKVAPTPLKFSFSSFSVSTSPPTSHRWHLCRG
jgi:hypothetical protein